MFFFIKESITRSPDRIPGLLEVMLLSIGWQQTDTKEHDIPNFLSKNEEEIYQRKFGRAKGIIFIFIFIFIFSKYMNKCKKFHFYFFLEAAT